MSKKNKILISYIFYILFCIICFFLLDKYSTDNTIIFFIGIFLTITGIWGNVLKIVLIKIPTGNLKYSIINFLIISIGALCSVFGVLIYYKVI